MFVSRLFRVPWWLFLHLCGVGMGEGGCVCLPDFLLSVIMELWVGRKGMHILQVAKRHRYMQCVISLCFYGAMTHHVCTVASDTPSRGCNSVLMSSELRMYARHCCLLEFQCRFICRRPKLITPCLLVYAPFIASRESSTGESSHLWWMPTTFTSSNSPRIMFSP